MTVADLIERLKLCRQDSIVCVPVSDGGFPATPCINIKSIGSGIDWDSGKVFFWPEKPVYLKSPKPNKIKNHIIKATGAKKTTEQE